MADAERGLAAATTRAQCKEIERLLRVISRALSIAKDGEPNCEHADLVRIGKILECSLSPAPEPADDNTRRLQD